MISTPKMAIAPRRKAEGVEASPPLPPYQRNDRDQKEISNLVETVIGELGEKDIKDVEENGSCSSSPDFDWSAFWAYYLAIPTIFTHSVATRMQFLYGALYGRNGLHLPNALAILAVGMTAAGRATAPPLLLKNFNAPYMFVFLNATTLIGSAVLFLIPVVGRKENFDENGFLEEGMPINVGAVMIYYFAMFIQGLAEVVSGWDVLMKFEMKEWTPARQQIGFRASFVAVAMGSSSGFYLSTALFESYGLYGCAYLGTVVGIMNLIFPCFYLARRWSIFDSWRARNDKERARLCRTSSGLMRLYNVDGNEEVQEANGQGAGARKQLRRQSTQRLDFNTSSSSKLVADHREKKEYVHYVEPRNLFEYREALQHQTSERIVKNFVRLSRHDSARDLADTAQDMVREDILTAFNPTVLLTHSEHINWPAKFDKQIKILKWFCILALALGSTMISSQFAVYTLYLVDVWNVSSVFAGMSMAVGEIVGMLTLLLSIFVDKAKTSKKDSDAMAAAKKGGGGSSHGACGALLRNPGLLLHVPSTFVVCCALAVIPLTLLGFWRAPVGIEDMDVSEISSQSSFIVAMLSGTAIGIINCVMHATSIEMSALLLLDDWFESAVAVGYSIKRIVNFSITLLATLLYSLSEYAVYQVTALLYFLSVPVSIWILAFNIQCMPWQKRDVILDKPPKDETVKSHQFSIDQFDSIPLVHQIQPSHHRSQSSVRSRMIFQSKTSLSS